jgi:hypothetical protein
LHSNFYIHNFSYLTFGYTEKYRKQLDKIANLNNSALCVPGLHGKVGLQRALLWRGNGGALALLLSGGEHPAVVIRVPSVLQYYLMINDRRPDTAWEGGKEGGDFLLANQESGRDQSEIERQWLQHMPGSFGLLQPGQQYRFQGNHVVVGQGEGFEPGYKKRILIKSLSPGSEPLPFTLAAIFALCQPDYLLLTQTTPKQYSRAFCSSQISLMNVAHSILERLLFIDFTIQKFTMYAL